jgi:hypothetical protein
MTIKDRIDKAAEIMSGEVNETSRQVVVDGLLNMGIHENSTGLDLLTSEDFLFGDARAEFCDKGKVPITIFRRMYKVLHGEDKKEETPTVAVGGLGETVVEAMDNMAKSMRTIGAWDDEELLKAYGPDCKPQVLDELSARISNKRCIAFEADKKSVNLEITLKMMKQARTRAQMPSHFRGDKRTYILYGVGSFPEVVYDVCPVTGELMIDNYSSELGYKWTIALEGRQYIALMVDQGVRIDAMSIDAISEVYDKDGIEGLQNKFPKVTPIFEDLKETGRLPALKAKDVKSDNRKVEKPFQTQVNYKAKRH